jgi:hypothetical protein
MNLPTGKLEALARNISIGAHHDAITGTSKAHVHIDEQIIFNNANEALRILQIENLHMNFKVETIASDGDYEYL